ncbi:MAG: hypothetical protein IMZ52_07750 [Actinobacteria bacterium]|nr:hypothetical protein [Actinomycetota bacterium]
MTKKKIIIQTTIDDTETHILGQNLTRDDIGTFCNDLEKTGINIVCMEIIDGTERFINR